MKEDPTVCDDTFTDHNNLDRVLYCKHSFSVLKLVIIILNIAYFLGIFWLIFCNFSLEMVDSGYDTATAPGFYFLG